MPGESMWLPVKWIFVYDGPGRGAHSAGEMILQPATPLKTVLEYIREKIAPHAAILAAGDEHHAYWAYGESLDMVAEEDMTRIPWRQVEQFLMERYADEQSEHHTVVMKWQLHQVADVSLGNPDADFWVTISGTRETIGRPTREYNPEHAGIEVFRKDLVDPAMLFKYINGLHADRNVFHRLAQETSGGVETYQLSIETLNNMPVMVVLNP